MKNIILANFLLFLYVSFFTQKLELSAETNGVVLKANTHHFFEAYSSILGFEAIEINTLDGIFNKLKSKN